MIQPGDGTTTESMIQTTHSNHHHGHHPKPTHEPSELESFTFYYDYNTVRVYITDTTKLCKLFSMKQKHYVE